MPMIEPGRTNIIPRTLLILCIALFVLRAGAVFYGTYFHKGPDKDDFMSSWSFKVPCAKHSWE